MKVLNALILWRWYYLAKLIFIMLDLALLSSSYKILLAKLIFIMLVVENNLPSNDHALILCVAYDHFCVQLHLALNLTLSVNYDN